MVGYQRALVRGARFLAGGVGAAHTRQLYTAVCTEWRRALSRSRSKRLSAPSWLWSSVVELMVSHEAAYLEHCCKYARAADGPWCLTAGGNPFWGIALTTGLSMQ